MRARGEASVLYLPIEPLRSRYTEQLCTRWRPDGFRRVGIPEDAVLTVLGQSQGDDVETGRVLDAHGRMLYSLTQSAEVVRLLRDDYAVGDDVTLFFEDFWTPGLDAIRYAAHERQELRVAARCWAQSVDPHDFTNDMLPWIGGYELAVADRLDLLTVASDNLARLCHRAGWRPRRTLACGLPVDPREIRERVGASIRPADERQPIVCFTSRLDLEKQPRFMLAVARRVLERNREAIWRVTTSANTFRSNDPTVLEELRQYAAIQPRFVMLPGLSKDDYYGFLASSRVQFNCSLQDFVAFTQVEASALGCARVYPDTPEFLETAVGAQLYETWDADKAAAAVLNQLARPTATSHDVASLCDLGRLVECAAIVDPLIDDDALPSSVFREPWTWEDVLRCTRAPDYKRWESGE